MSPAPRRPIRTPNYPPLLDRAAADIGGKTATFHFTGTREEAQAILDEIDLQVKALGAKSMSDGEEGGE